MCSKRSERSDAKIRVSYTEFEFGARMLGGKRRVCVIQLWSIEGFPRASDLNFVTEEFVPGGVVISRR